METKDVFSEVFLLDPSFDDIVALVQMEEVMELHVKIGIIHTTVYPATVSRQCTLHHSIRDSGGHHKCLATH